MPGKLPAGSRGFGLNQPAGRGCPTCAHLLGFFFEQNRILPRQRGYAPNLREKNRPSIKENNAVLQCKATQRASKVLIETIQVSLNDDKAKDIAVINLIGKASFADYMVIATGTSQRQVTTMANHLCKKLKAQGLKSVSTEGLSLGNWVLIDGGDVVIHLFRQEFRTFYDLDKLWGNPLPRPDQAAYETNWNPKRLTT